MKPIIVFTGGGTAGHVTPNVALMSELKNEGWQTVYVGSQAGIEKEMMRRLGVPFYAVSSGKLRRYFSLKNLLDPFKIIWGTIQSFRLLHQLKPDVVFSKGGFVAFPVVVGAWLNRVPVVAHESDMTPGLANRLSFPFVSTICLTFELAKKHFKCLDKVVVTGTPIRPELFLGDPTRGLARCGFTKDKPCVLVIGGSLGAASINRVVREAISQWTEEFQVIHLCGKGKIDPILQGVKGYCQLEYANEELADFFSAASIVVSRAGANALYEILALAKPHILIPLSDQVSRGDQIQNAKYFEQLGVSCVIEDDLFNSNRLMAALHDVIENKNQLINKMNQLGIQSATPKLLKIIKEQAHVESQGIV